MNRQIRQVAFLVLVMFATLALSVTSVQGLARPSVWESWSANGALNSDPRNRRTVSRNFDTERGPILLAGGTTIASTQKSDNGQGSEDYQRVYANGPLYAPVTGYFSPAFASMTGMEKEGNSVLNGDDPSLFSSRIKTLITGDSQRGGAVELTIKPEIQQAAYDALGGREGAVVALDPQDRGHPRPGLHPLLRPLGLRDPQRERRQRGQHDPQPGLLSPPGQPGHRRQPLPAGVRPSRSSPRRRRCAPARSRPIRRSTPPTPSPCRAPATPWRTTEGSPAAAVGPPSPTPSPSPATLPSRSWP